MSQQPIIADAFGRRFPYVRLSLTDKCNFRCSYCLPNGYKKCDSSSDLSVEEISRLAWALSDLGVWKFRLTGGEPTIRPDFLEIVRSLSSLSSVRKLAFTTNGYKLPERAQSYFDAGLRAINISIDSLKSEQFKNITGHDRLAEVIEGILACQDAGFQSIKINTVLLKGLNDVELDDFISFVSDKPVSLRFIELMRTRDNQKYFNEHHLPGSYVTQRLLSLGWHVKKRENGAGPAVEFEHDDSFGSIGLIAPYSKDFCKSCNRLRFSAKGSLHLCLFGEGGYSLRDLLQSDDQQFDLKERILSLMNLKKETHFLHQGYSGATPHLASIGG